MAEHDLGIEERLRRKMGRPARTESIATRFTKDEARRVKDAAARQGMTVREWSRATMLQAVDGVQTDPLLLTELVALQLLATRIFRSLATDDTLITKEEFEQLLKEIRDNKAEGARRKIAEWRAKTAE